MAHITQVVANFEHLFNESEEERGIRLMLSIMFDSKRSFDELLLQRCHYQGQVEYVIDRDADRCEGRNSQRCYVLHVVAFDADGRSPGYSDAVAKLIGDELYQVLQPEWQTVLVELAASVAADAGGMAADMYKVREDARADIRERRRAYKASFEDGACVLKRLLEITEVTHS